jgi:antiviral helicase SKI2
LIKARIAKELGENELFLCEIIVDNVLQNLSYVEIASLLSGFVNQHKPRRQKFEGILDEIEVDVDEIWSEKFKSAAARVYDISMKITIQEIEEKVIIIAKEEIEKYLFENVLNFSLAKVIYLWAEGKDFAEILMYSDAQEGIIVRTILRLENLLKNLKSAAKIIGNIPLYNKIDRC